MREAVTGLLVPESLEDNPLPGLHPAEQAWEALNASADLLETDPIPGDGQPRGLVLHSPVRRLRLPGPGDGLVGDGQFAVIAGLSSSGGLVNGSLRRPGAGLGEAVLIPAEQLAGLIRQAQGYAPGVGVVLMVPGLATSRACRFPSTTSSRSPTCWTRRPRPPPATIPLTAGSSPCSGQSWNSRSHKGGSG